jgi:hypothetical protein
MNTLHWFKLGNRRVYFRRSRSGAWWLTRRR